MSINLKLSSVRHCMTQLLKNNAALSSLKRLLRQHQSLVDTTVATVLNVLESFTPTETTSLSRGS